jgi:SRSO17 transposase
MRWTETQWRANASALPRFLTPLTDPMGRRERRVGAALYIQGLLLPGQRKSIEPMAERLQVDSQRLQQFIADSPWDERAVWRAIRQEVGSHVEPLLAWIVDETGWLKQGKHSVGVAHQYCGAVGKSANCQVNVQVALTDGLAALPVGARLYLPEAWTKDRPRCRAAGVPTEIGFATKPEIALQLIEEALSDGLAKAPVLGDSAYGDSGPFRDGLRRLDLEFFLQIDPRQTKGWARPVPIQKQRTLWKVRTGTPVPKTLLDLFADQKSVAWHHCSWKTADGQTRHTRLAWLRVYLPGALDRRATNLEEVWLVVDWPEGQAEAYHYYLAHLQREPTRARALQLSRSRWNIEQFFQRDKDDLGLDHYEGRSWRGFHHHLVMAVVAYLFVTAIFLRAKKNFWCDVGTDTEADPAVAGEIGRILQLLSAKI